MDEQVERAAPVVRVEVALSAFTRRSRSISIHHLEHRLPRGLDLGEHLLLHDPGTGTHWTGIVADVDFTAADTHYRIELGTRITDAEARHWLAPCPSGAGGALSTGDVAALLIALRRSQQGVRETYRSYVAESAGTTAPAAPYRVAGERPS